MATLSIRMMTHSVMAATVAKRSGWPNFLSRRVTPGIGRRLDVDRQEQS
jgi:hypothetical protein